MFWLPYPGPPRPFSVLNQVAERWPGDGDRLRRMSLIEEGDSKQVRMANLAIVGSHSVNGVSAVHSRLVETELVPDFQALWPERFNNKTNGVTPRRWLLAANPGLARLISEVAGANWVTEFERLRELEGWAQDPSFQERFAAIKRANKERLAALMRPVIGQPIDCDSLFDVHAKRIHEYKRQLLKVLHIAHEYLRLAEDGQSPWPPRTFVFAGKAAPGYYAAKQIIRLIHDLAQVINRDPRARGCLRVVFVPDYRVSLAEALIPAADLSEQISTAGTEASGTGNMKFAMNGALTVGTLDGANIEIRDAVGPENFFLFGLTVSEIRRLQSERAYHPWEVYQRDARVRRIVDAFRSDRFCPHARGRHDWVCQRLLADGEHYFHLADLPSYFETQDQVSALYSDRAAWSQTAIRNVARIGKFSSDRTVREYAQEIWNLGPVL